MQEISGKTAFITGGAHGIGLAIAVEMAKRGANVMLADINEAGLLQAKEKLGDYNVGVETCLCDVAKSADIQAAADKTIEQFGKVHFLFNNAGVGLWGNAGDTPLKDWQWIVDINLMGVVYGCEIFTPLIKNHGEGGHIVNTASLAGHITLPHMAPYHATKFAVVGYSESLRQNLAMHNIGVSVLCPGWVKTDIHLSARTSPSLEVVDYTPPDPNSEEGMITQMMAEVIENGMDPAKVAEWVAKCIIDNRLYIFTHPDLRMGIEERVKALMVDHDAADEHFK